MADDIRIEQALRRGHLTVNLPVATIMFSPWIVALVVFRYVPATGHAIPTPVMLATTYILVSACLLSVPAAWLWWSFAVPRWKLWAYSRVRDIDGLKTLAVAQGLIWPDGHFFEKTEICPRYTRRKILELEGRL